MGKPNVCESLVVSSGGFYNSPPVEAFTRMVSCKHTVLNVDSQNRPDMSAKLTMHSGRIQDSQYHALSAFWERVNDCTRPEMGNILANAVLGARPPGGDPVLGCARIADRLCAVRCRSFAMPTYLTAAETVSFAVHQILPSSTSRSRDFEPPLRPHRRSRWPSRAACGLSSEALCEPGAGRRMTSRRAPLRKGEVMSLEGSASYALRRKLFGIEGHSRCGSRMATCGFIFS